MNDHIYDQDVFIKDVNKTISIYERSIGHFALGTRSMIDKYGPVDALSRLMKTSEFQKGFKVLRDQNMIHHTFESLVLRYKEKFRNDVVEAAQWRIDNPYIDL